MSGHTPGPWVVKHDVVIYGRDSFTIIGSAGTGNLHRPDEIANASLIATAPDLLEVAELVMSWWEDSKYDTCGENGEWNTYPVEPIFVGEARKAIARAKGEA